MADEIQYKLDDVEATSVAPNDIDQTFRSSGIGTKARTWKSTRHTRGCDLHAKHLRPHMTEG